MQKSCYLNPLPASLLKKHFDVLLPSICRILNLSLESGHSPSSLKSAVLTALLKKPNLDHEVLSNFRHISNLKVIFKVIEKVVAVRFQAYLNSKSRYDRPTNHFTATKPPLSVFRTTFCLLLIIGTVSCSCYLVSPLYLTLLTMKYCSKD